MGVLDGKVAIVTGSGGGIGRSHALALAKAGAKVVVNDLGGDRSGTGGGKMMADEVVSEIRALGGEAAANYDAVGSMDAGKAIVKTALDAFGRLDILVNNAGILRDKTLLKTEESMWDPVIQVHLKGTFACVQAAAAAMKEAGRGGRIINSSSTSGLIGNFGQGNYGAAKAGIYGLTRVASMEFERLGITVNAIAPVAKTRMTDDLPGFSQGGLDHLTPDHISPIIVFLASDAASKITGKCFDVGGQHLGMFEVRRSPGVDKAGTEPWTYDEIVEKIDAIMRWP